MSALPTTRASRSRYQSPAVGGTGAGAGAGAKSRAPNDRTSKDSDKERDSARGRESRDASSSLDRSRQFMEAWIEPERARLASFQEDGLVRQGVLETMEPLGARPRPSVFKKLFGTGSPFQREGSAAVASANAGSGQDGGGASTPVPRKSGAKRIVVLKRKNGKGEKVASDGNISNVNGRPGLSVSASGTQSPTPSTTIATPQHDPEPEPELETDPQAVRSHTASSTPAPLADPDTLPAQIPEIHSPTPTPTGSAATDRQTSASILPTSDTIQPEPEDSFSANLTHTSQQQPRMAVSHSSPTLTPQPNSYDSPSRLPSVPPPMAPSLTPSLAESAIFPPSYAPNPTLPDPIKQSIEGPPSLPTQLPATPSSVVLYNDADDSTFFKRESSAQSAPIPDMASTRAAASQQARARTGSATVSSSAGNGAGNLATSEPAASVPQGQPRAPRQDGPYITDAEMARIVQPLQKEVVTRAIEHGVNECLKHHHYDKAYAYRQIYEEYQDNPQYLLLAESIFRQTASKDAVFRWGLLIQHKIAEGQRDKTAVMYFVPEARDNKDFVPHQPQPAPYRHLITLDLSRLQDLAGDSDCKQRSHDEIDDESVSKTEPQPKAEPEQQEVQINDQTEIQLQNTETELERVATPPRPAKRQKLQTREPSSARSATGHKTASRGMNGRGNASPSRRKTRSGSVASDSSLSSARSVTPPPPPTQELVDEDKQMQNVGDTRASAATGVVDGERLSSAETPDAIANANTQEPEPAAQPQPMMTRPRRAPARRGRNAIASQPDSHSSQPPQNSSATNTPAANGTPAPPPPQQRSRNPRRGAPDFTPTQKLDENDEVTKRRRAAKQFTINLTNKARSQVISDVRHELRPGEAMRDHSPQSDLSSVPEVEDVEPSPPPPPTAQPGRSARAARQNKRQHDQVDGDDDVHATSPSFPPEPSTGVTSRAVTPIRPAKRPRTGPRLKVS